MYDKIKNYTTIYRYIRKYLERLDGIVYDFKRFYYNVMHGAGREFLADELGWRIYAGISD